MTQDSLALEAEVPRAYVNRVERGAINISIDNAEVLAKAVGVPLRDLVDPDESPDIDDA